MLDIGEWSIFEKLSQELERSKDSKFEARIGSTLSSTLLYLFRLLWLSLRLSLILSKDDFTGF